MQRESITERIDNITEIRGDYVSDAPPCPKSVKIELTGHCNFSCQYCARSQRLRVVGEMDRGFFDELLDDLLEAGVEELGLFYLGESFLLSRSPILPCALSPLRRRWGGSAFDDIAAGDDPLLAVLANPQKPFLGEVQ